MKTTLNCFASGALAAFVFFAEPAQAIQFWHSDTTWAGQGQCSAQFTFDGSGEWSGIKNLRVSVYTLDKSGKKVASGVLEVGEFATSEANRYASAFLEGEGVCEDDLTVVVSKATAVIDGQQRNLLQEKLLSAKSFKPFKIRLGK